MQANAIASGRKLKVLVVSHGHPDVSTGGGEVAAYSFFKALKNSPRIEQAWFVGADHQNPSGRLSQLREGEFLWGNRGGDPFLMKSALPYQSARNFARFLELIQPDVINFHHYIHIGTEAIQIARKTCPKARIVFSLHEMLAICLKDGQMVKTGNHNLCETASHHACARCFPERPVEDFWLRERYFKKIFENVDRFIAPSQFIKERHVQWGIDAAKIGVVENILPSLAPADDQNLDAAYLAKRVGYFGQITQYKGLDLLLEALNLVADEIAGKLYVEIHGANLDIQKDDFQQKIADLLEPLSKAGIVRWVGPYGRNELERRMRQVGWVVVPSIWWENSPVVIQEAFAMKRPVLCSDIGGMAEKVRHGTDGLHFAVRNPHALAEQLLKLAGNVPLWEKLRSGIHPRQDSSAAVEKMLDQFV